jgi:hypothetical protein
MKVKLEGLVWNIVRLLCNEPIQRGLGPTPLGLRVPGLVTACPGLPTRVPGLSTILVRGLWPTRAAAESRKSTLPVLESTRVRALWRDEEREPEDREDDVDMRRAR